MVSLTRGKLKKGLKTSLTAAGAAQACDLVPAIPKSGKLDKVPSLTQGHPSQEDSSKPRVPVLRWRHVTPGALRGGSHMGPGCLAGAGCGGKNPQEVRWVCRLHPGSEQGKRGLLFR